MTLDPKLFLHDSDKAAMEALKAIPGFSQVTKAFMKNWDEKCMRMINMSSNLRLSEKQLGKYYDMLPPICAKLGIEVPELYVTLNVVPNAWTYGDTKPYIVITSGLFETLPDELIPTVLAHECGHIACHHTLYTTMGNLIMNGLGAASILTGIGNIALYPIQLAFAYWMRCSEFSADRAAVICDVSAEKTVEMMMYFAGYHKGIAAEANAELFMEQADQYRELVGKNVWSKAMEYYLFSMHDHPLTAVRAQEAHEWEQTERCRDIIEYVNAKPETIEDKEPVELQLKKMIGKNVEDIRAKFLMIGFTNINAVRNMTATKKKAGSVLSISINGNSEDGWYKRPDEVMIEYFEPETEDEIAQKHPGEIQVKDNYKYFQGKNFDDVKAELMVLGFTNFTVKEMAMAKIGIGAKEGSVAKIIIDNRAQFAKGSWFPEEAEVVLYRFVRI